MTESLTSGAWEVPHQCSLGPACSAPEHSQLHTPAYGLAGRALQRQEPLQQEPEARESALPKGSCKAGEQKGCGTSSELGNLPSIADLPRISSPYHELQVGRLTLLWTCSWLSSHRTSRIVMPLEYSKGI